MNYFKIKQYEFSCLTVTFEVMTWPILVPKSNVIEIRLGKFYFIYFSSSWVPPIFHQRNRDSKIFQLFTPPRICSSVWANLLHMHTKVSKHNSLLKLFIKYLIRNAVNVLNFSLLIARKLQIGPNFSNTPIF